MTAERTTAIACYLTGKHHFQLSELIIRLLRVICALIITRGYKFVRASSVLLISTCIRLIGTRTMSRSLVCLALSAAVLFGFLAVDTQGCSAYYFYGGEVSYTITAVRLLRFSVVFAFYFRRLCALNSTLTCMPAMQLLSQLATTYRKMQIKLLLVPL